MKVPFVLQALVCAVSAPFQKVHTANICRHKTRQKGFIYDGKTTSIMEMPLAMNGHPDYCLECIGKMSIQCAWCGEPITVGEPISLYFPNNDVFKLSDYAVKYGNGEKQSYVCCLRWDCADTSADMCGYWLPPGEVRRIQSPMELCLQTGQTVVLGDLRNYRATASLHDT